jgi:TrmH family RNA methyltransferase
MTRDDFCVVLVETEESRNVGSAARAMANLGFADLRLVAPVGLDRGRAHVTAHHAAPLVDAAAFHGSLGEALADVHEAVAFSGRAASGRLNAVESLPEWAAGLGGPTSRRVALVFGPEGSGLRQEHLDLCARTVRIPAPGEYPSFNLAQAVLLALWEVSRALDDGGEVPQAPPEPLPTGAEFDRLDQIVLGVMRESGFLRDGTPVPVPGTVKNLLRRLAPDRREMGILLALFGKVGRELGRRKNNEDLGGS